MRNEVESAANFLKKMMQNKQNKNYNYSQYQHQLEQFRCSLTNELCLHYQEHWFPEKPNKGSGYRCIRINHKLDPIVSKAGSECGFTEEILRETLPNELTLWVDPKEVSYRIGENGSICVLYDGSNRAETEKIEEYTEKIKVMTKKLKSISLAKSSDDSGYSTPMSVSPPTPSFERMSTCKSEFRYSTDLIMENRNNGFMEFVAS